VQEERYSLKDMTPALFASGPLNRSMERRPAASNAAGKQAEGGRFVKAFLTQNIRNGFSH